MNPTLSQPQVDACLEVLYRGLVNIRLAALAGDAKRAEALADALHNLPHLLARGHLQGWTLLEFRELFLAPLAHDYPDDLAALTHPLDALRTPP